MVLVRFRHLQRDAYITLRILHPIVQQITDNLRKRLPVHMCIKILFRHLQGEFQTFLFGKGSETHMSLFQDLRYIAFRKIQAESLTFRFTEVK